MSQPAPAGSSVDYAELFDAVPTPYLVLRADGLIMTVNTAYEQISGRFREAIRGRDVLEVFPDITTGSDGSASELTNSFRRVVESKRAHELAAYRYDVRDRNGQVRERWWSALALPVLDEAGEVVLILQRVEDITARILSRSPNPDPGPGAGSVAAVSADRRALDAAHGTRHLELIHEPVAGLLHRPQLLRDALATEEAAARQLQGLVDVALALGAAHSVVQVTEVIVRRGFAVLGADGGAVAVLQETGDFLDLVFTASIDANVARAYPRLALSAPLPVCVAAATGRPVILANHAAHQAWGAQTSAATAALGYHATVSLPLRAGSELLGSLSIGWAQERDVDERELRLMEAFAAQCAQALQRIRARQRELHAVATERRLSATLQRSLLTRPLQVDHLQIAVRYLPAAAQDQVGGDWYDSFLSPTGAITLVIGDVAGHDLDAAAAMAQVRNLLRGVALSLGETPAAVLRGLDTAMHGLGVDTVATAVLAQVEQSDTQADAGLRTLRWSNAGHPPPVLLEPHGVARLLDTAPELLLGFSPDTKRGDHTVELQPGATVVFYTDGLIERRGQPLEKGLEWLRATVQACHGLPAEQLCDQLIGDLDPDHDDDIALLVLVAHPENGPRRPDTSPASRPSAPGPRGLRKG